MLSIIIIVIMAFYQIIGLFLVADSIGKTRPPITKQVVSITTFIVSAHIAGLLYLLSQIR